MKKHAAILLSFLLALGIFASGAQALEQQSDALAQFGWYYENYHMLQRDPAYRLNPPLHSQFTDALDAFFSRVFLQVPALYEQGLLEAAAAGWLEECIAILQAFYGVGAQRLTQLKGLIDDYARLEQELAAYKAAPTGNGHAWQIDFQADIARRTQAHLAFWHSGESTALRITEDNLDSLIILYAQGCDNLERIVSRYTAAANASRPQDGNLSALLGILNALNAGERPGSITTQRWALLLEEYARHEITWNLCWENAACADILAFLQAYDALLAGLYEALHQDLPPEPPPIEPPDSPSIPPHAPAISGESSLTYLGTVILEADQAADFHTSNSNVRLIRLSDTQVQVESVRSFIKTGSAVIQATPQGGGPAAAVTIQISPSFTQWLMIIFLFGWIWM